MEGTTFLFMIQDTPNPDILKRHNKVLSYIISGQTNPDAEVEWEIRDYLLHMIGSDNASEFTRFFDLGFNCAAYLPQTRANFLMNYLITCQASECLEVFMQREQSAYTRMDFMYKIASNINMPTICFAAATSNQKILEQLVRYGADIHAKDKHESDALSWILIRASENYLGMLEFLLQLGLTPQYTNTKARTSSEQNLVLTGIDCGIDITDIFIKYTNSLPLLEQYQTQVEDSLPEYSGERKVQATQALEKIQQKIDILSSYQMLSETIPITDKIKFKNLTFLIDNFSTRQYIL